MKIYTKTGDTGITSLWGHAGLKRVSKDSVRVESYGAVDEANAAIGAAMAFLGNSGLLETLGSVQNALFAVGADLSNISPDRVDRLEPAQLGDLEKQIDALEENLPPLREFILPGGSPGSSLLHVARTVVRRAERRVVALITEEPSYAAQLKYLNRLSDYLFVAAREVNRAAGVGDRAAKF